MNQCDGVYSAVCAVLGTTEFGGKVELNKAQKEQVYALLHHGFTAGEIEHRNLPDSAALSKYIPGLVNNWCRKDKRLNGGVKYVTQRPGIRAGSGDESLKAMKQLLAQTEDEDIRATIEAAIAQRHAELKPKVAVNVEALPPSLRKFVAQ